jgi:hypothetical protein
MLQHLLLLKHNTLAAAAAGRLQHLLLLALLVLLLLHWTELLRLLLPQSPCHLIPLRDALCQLPWQLAPAW